METVKTVDFTMFKRGLTIVVTDGIDAYMDEHDLRSWTDYTPEDSIDDMAIAITIRADREHYIITHPDATWGVAAHESVHAVGFILSGCGHRADYSNDEMFAYFVEHVANAIQQAIAQYEIDRCKSHNRGEPQASQETEFSL
jgi:hypothetical protein